MNLIGPIVSGIIIVLSGALILYWFKIKQLYLVVPKMFAYGALTGKGKIIEMRAFNKGRSMEEEIHIDMPPDLSYELIAADHPDIKLVKNKILLDRFTPSSDISIILLVEGANELDNFTPSVNSKTTKGKVLKKIEEIPPNIGNIVLSVIITAVAFLLISYIPHKIIEHTAQKGKEHYGYLEKEGWREYDNYISSPINQIYPNYEFPVSLSSAKRLGDELELSFYVTNKTSSIASVSAYFTSDEDGSGISMETLKGKCVLNLQVSPVSSQPVIVSKRLTRKLKLSSIYVLFDLKLNGKTLWIKFYPSLNKLANKAMQS